MKSLARVKLRAGGAGAPLPVVFQALEDRKIRIRRGQATIVAAPPNSGKSLWALYYVLRLARKGVRTLYMSADTDEHDQKIRAATMLTGHSYETVDTAYQEEAGEYYDDVLAGVDGVRFDFLDSPTFEHIEENVLAHNELWGVYPDLIVIDNLGNLVLEYEDEYRGLKDATRAFKHMARETGAAFLLLHHANETEVDPQTPAARKNITGKISQFVENAITLVLVDSLQEMRFASVKNRSGKKDASGKDFATIWVKASNCQFYNSKFDLQTEGIPI